MRWSSEIGASEREIAKTDYRFGRARLEPASDRLPKQITDFFRDREDRPNNRFPKADYANSGRFPLRFWIKFGREGVARWKERS